MVANRRILLAAALALAVPLMLGTGSTWAAIQNLDDGAMQDPNGSGGWVLPNGGACYPDATQLTRPECLALRFPTITTQATCTAGTAPNVRSWSTSACNDTVNTTQLACEAAPGRMWNPSGDPNIPGVCSVTMKGYDRNRAVCTVVLGGTWVTSGTCTGSWVLPPASTYTPPLFTGDPNSLASPGTGDQCLRCHRSDTEWNGPRLRDVESYLKTGHKNMARKVVSPFLPWAGPEGTIYPADDSGNPYNWGAGTVNVGGMDKPLYWIYGDWLAPLPRSVYATGPGTSRACTDPTKTTQTACETAGGSWILSPGVSYSCGRCHTTNWTSDAVINTAKEPEKTFPGITWNRTADATAGTVNLTGGVSGDTNRYSSWDLYGITCTRCHSSAVQNSGNGSCSVSGFFDSTTCAAAGGTWRPGLPLPSPLGRSSHHSVMTSATGSSGGYCSDFTLSGVNRMQCEFLGNTWYAQCSDPLWPTKASCESAGPVCNDPSHATETACTTNFECSNPFYTTSAACAAAGGTWSAHTWILSKAPATWTDSYCSIGTCSNPSYTDPSDCMDNGGTWTSTWTSQIECEDAGGHFTGTKTHRGQMITSLCMNCHRQETGGMPYDANNPAGALKVGPAHGTVGFVSHPHANQFLNSPHAKYTGTFANVATSTMTFNPAGAGYHSFFIMEGEAGNAGNGCTGCHDPHRSIVKAAGTPGAIKEECTECHSKNLGTILHPKGLGTPLENMMAEPAEACISCHMPEEMHLYRINSDPSYSTFPPAALTATVNANTAPDGSYANAVWVDLDHACGKCHGGGTGQLPGPTNSTTGTIASLTPSANAKILTVASTAGFAAGQRIRIAGAGALEADGVTRGEFDSYIVSVDPNTNTVNLAGGASKAVTNAIVMQNPTANGGAYMTKNQLAVYAAGIHNDKPIATFGYRLGSPNSLIVDVDASASTCSGSAGNCDAYEWDWGDGSAPDSGVLATHTYAGPGIYTISLTVEEYGVNSDTVSQNVTTYAYDAPPVADGLCTFDADTWTMTVTDSSTDDNLPLKQVTVNWGDGSMLGNDTTSPYGPFTHTYRNAGTYTLTQKAVDSIGQQNTRTCQATPAYFTISGTVLNNAGTMPLAFASVTLRKGGVVAKTVYTAANGTFSAGGLKPGTYTLTLSKAGYTFPVPAATITVGPSSTGNNINAN